MISYAEGEIMMPLSDHIHISLTDHLSFAYNKLLGEIKVLYKQNKKLESMPFVMYRSVGVELPDDEAGYVALHIHTAK